MDALLPVAIDPVWIGTAIITIIAGYELWLLKDIVGLGRDYARMLVAKSRITADGKVVLTEADMPEFIDATFDFMVKFETIVSKLFGFILNHPSTGWIKAYQPSIVAAVSGAVQELAKEGKAEDTGYVFTSSTTVPESQTTEEEQQTQSVGQPG